MNTQLSIPYQPHSHTSYAAAERSQDTADTQRARVYDALLRAGRYGMTDQEIQHTTHLPGDTERPRRLELVNLRRVVDSGTTRRTCSGKLATVWVAKEYETR